MDNIKNNLILKKILLIICILIMTVGCQSKTVETTKNEKTTVSDNHILHVSLNDDENALSSIYLMSEDNEFSSTFISKYDIGAHSKSYKIIIKSEYQEMIEYLDMNMPSSSTVTSLYITMDNYTFIVALFNETELVSRQTFDISKYNQESENFVCKSSTNNKISAIGSNQRLENDLIVYDTTLVMVHGDEEWNEDNEEQIRLSVTLEEQ